jgi:hypothetical protein
MHRSAAKNPLPTVFADLSVILSKDQGTQRAWHNQSQHRRKVENQYKNGF